MWFGSSICFRCLQISVRRSAIYEQLDASANHSILECCSHWRELFLPFVLHDENALNFKQAVTAVFVTYNTPYTFIISVYNTHLINYDGTLLKTYILIWKHTHTTKATLFPDLYLDCITSHIFLCFQCLPLSTQFPNICNAYLSVFNWRLWDDKLKSQHC